MPQFDTFSFFSQLFWVLIGFSYLYLLLCFYLLPAIAAVVKTRTKKLSQINSNSNTGSLQINETTILTDNWAYFYSITPNDDSIVTKTIETPVKITSSNYKFNFSTQTNNLIREFKFISFFL